MQKHHQQQQQNKTEAVYFLEKKKNNKTLHQSSKYTLARRKHIKTHFPFSCARLLFLYYVSE